MARNEMPAFKRAFCGERGADDKCRHSDRLRLVGRFVPPIQFLYFSINFNNLSLFKFFNFFSKAIASLLVSFSITQMISQGIKGFV